MKTSEHKSYDELPLFLNAKMVAKVLGVSPSSRYELVHEADCPVLRVGSRIAVPKEKFVNWMEWCAKGSGFDFCANRRNCKICKKFLRGRG